MSIALEYRTRPSCVITHNRDQGGKFWSPLSAHGTGAISGLMACPLRRQSRQGGHVRPVFARADC